MAIPPDSERRVRGLRVLVAIAVALVLPACDGGGGGPRTTASDPSSTSTPPRGCPQTAPEGRPFTSSARARPQVLSAGGEGQPEVQAVVYPHPDYDAKQWSQWGQGYVTPDGRFWSAVGDHNGVDGNSFFYEFDPAKGVLTQVGDAQAVVGHRPGAWGYGKVHGQIVPGPCGELYAATYWGTKKDLVFGNGYEGDVLVRIDPSHRTIGRVTLPVEKHGIPSLAGWTEGGLVYGEAVDPTAQEPGEGGGRDQALPRAGVFFAFDARAGEVVFRADPADHAGYRSVLVGPDGKAYFAAGGSKLQVFDPATRRVKPFASTLPGLVLRASSRPGPDGTTYGVARFPDTLFALRPDGRIDTIGPVRGYVTSIALSPDGRYVYYVPDAQGTSWEQGTPLVRVDTSTGKEDVVVKLNDLGEPKLGVKLGGTYDVAMDPAGKVLYIGFNAGSGKDATGTVVLVIVHLDR